MLDIIALGDATLDTFLKLDEASVSCSIDKTRCLLCLDYADKIPIKELEQKVAGNAANVAVGSSRLGLEAAFWTILGDDDFADKVIKKMKDEGVSTKYVKKDKGTDSNFTVVLNYEGERTQLIHRKPRDYDLPKMEKSRYVYLTAMGENHQKAYGELLDYLISSNAKLAYNPGKFQIMCNTKVCKSLYPFTEILFVNKEEAEMILKGKEPREHTKGIKKSPKSKILDLSKRLHKMGPEIVVITDGANGSYAYHDDELLFMPIKDGDVIEKTGAGDGYATGFIAAVAHGKSVKEAMAWGTINAWSVVQYVGPQDGLLTIGKMQKESKKIRDKVQIIS